MSYARWSHSYWYAFPMGDDWDLEICMVHKFKYEEVEKDIKKCIAIVKRECKKEFNPLNQPTKRDMDELEFIMKTYIREAKHKGSRTISKSKSK